MGPQQLNMSLEIGGGITVALVVADILVDPGIWAKVHFSPLQSRGVN